MIHLLALNNQNRYTYTTVVLSAEIFPFSRGGEVMSKKLLTIVSILMIAAFI